MNARSTWKCSPSAISAMPTITRKASASILVEGWSCTKSAIGPDASIITTIATMTAATITGRWSAMPTAVITLSSEKMTSSSMIWKITDAKPVPPLSSRSASSPAPRPR